MGLIGMRDAYGVQIAAEEHKRYQERDDKLMKRVLYIQDGNLVEWLW